MIMEPFRSNEMLLNAFAEAGFSPNSKVVHQILKVVHHLFSLGILGSPLRNGFKEPKYDLRFGDDEKTPSAHPQTLIDWICRDSAVMFDAPCMEPIHPISVHS